MLYTNLYYNYAKFQKICFIHTTLETFTLATKSSSDVCINGEQQHGEQQCGSDYNSNVGLIIIME